MEVSRSKHGNDQWNTFKTKAKQHGLKIWAFTINDNIEIKKLVELGVDGIETDRAWDAARFICDTVIGNAFENKTIANYIFNGNLQAQKVGSQIRLMNYDNPNPSEIPTFSTCSSYGLPLIENHDKTVMKLNAFGPNNGLMVYNNSRIETDGVVDNSYTIIMDVLIPTESYGNYIALFQTSSTNLNDADLFINPEGAIGISDEYHGYVEPDKWNRIALIFDGENGTLKKFINGVYVGSNDIASNSRFTIWNSSRSGDDQGFLLFSDDNNETAEVYVSAVQQRNYATSNETIERLGAPKANGVKLSNADIWDVKINSAIADSTLVDYENKSIYLVMPENSSSESEQLSFNVADNATADASSGQYIPLYTPFTINVTSEDASNQIAWKIYTRKMGNDSQESSQSLNLSIFPNPVSKHLFIKHLPANASSYQIFDTLGRTVKKGTVTQNLNSINVSKLKNGLFFIKVITHHGKKQVLKFQIAHH